MAWILKKSMCGPHRQEMTTLILPFALLPCIPEMLWCFCNILGTSFHNSIAWLTTTFDAASPEEFIPFFIQILVRRQGFLCASFILPTLHRHPRQNEFNHRHKAGMVRLSHKSSLAFLGSHRLWHFWTIPLTHVFIQYKSVHMEAKRINWLFH